MNSPDTRIARLTDLLRETQGTGRAFTIDVDEVFIQAASYEGDQLLVEVSGDEFLSEEKALSAADHAVLVNLGFQPPDHFSPNWHIPLSERSAELLRRAAHAAISALTDVMGADVEELDAALSEDPFRGYEEEDEDEDEFPSSGSDGGSAADELVEHDLAEGEGEALALKTTYGDVLLFPNGFASLNGEPLAERPVLEWMRTGDGRLSVRLQTPGGDFFPNLGFVPDTPANVSTLRTFVPGREDLHTLFLRLAVSEHYALTCIVTGTLYHDRLAEAALELEREHGPADDFKGWELAPRLRAASAAVNAFFWIRSADNNREQHHDEHDTWRAIQRWVRLSPWAEDFGFEILPSPPQPFAIWGPEVQIRRQRDPD